MESEYSICAQIMQQSLSTMFGSIAYDITYMTICYVSSRSYLVHTLDKPFFDQVQMGEEQY